VETTGSDGNKISPGRRRCLAKIISAPCGPIDKCSGADIDGNGTVEFIDLSMLMENWLVGVE